MTEGEKKVRRPFTLGKTKTTKFSGPATLDPLIELEQSLVPTSSPVIPRAQPAKGVVSPTRDATSPRLRPSAPPVPNDGSGSDLRKRLRTKEQPKLFCGECGGKRSGTKFCQFCGEKF